jgi:SAM-dependent methyltransferase
VRGNVHRAAAAGFGGAAAEYARTRPGYPGEAVDWLARELDLRAGRTVVDLGAGTGKLTQDLVRTGARVIAVEPVDEMRALIEPPAEALAGTAEAIPLDDASADAVTAAQAFHWFDHTPALAEIRRVLAPGGALAVVWNRFRDDDELNQAIRALIEPYQGDAPHVRDGIWDRALATSELFELAEQRSFDNPHHVPAGAMGERVGSTSFIASLPEAERARVVAAADELAGGHAVTLGQVTEVQVYR